MLYSLNEMSYPPPLRRFVFVNWEEEDSATLEVVAAGFSIHETDLLSEAALATDWNRPEEDEAWSHLQSTR